MSNIYEFPATENYTVEQALNKCLTEEGLEDVLIVGYDTEGDLVIRSSKMDRKTALFLLKKAEQWTLNYE